MYSAVVGVSDTVTTSHPRVGQGETGIDAPYRVSAAKIN